MAKAITPAEAERSCDAEDRPETEAAIQRVNKVLRSMRRGEKKAVDAGLLGASGRVREQTAALFRDAGWRIEFQSDQREGDFYWFSS